MEIKSTVTTTELTLTLTKREAEMLALVMMRNITIPDMLVRDGDISVEEHHTLSNMMEDIGLAL